MVWFLAKQIYEKAKNIEITKTNINNIVTDLVILKEKE